MYDADDGFAGTAPVGSFPKGKTKFGAYDFVGNVWEWTARLVRDLQGRRGDEPDGRSRRRAQGDPRRRLQRRRRSCGCNPAFRYHQLATAQRHGDRLPLRSCPVTRRRLEKMGEERTEWGLSTLKRSCACRVTAFQD